MNKRLKVFSDRLFVSTHVAVAYIASALSPLWEMEIYAQEAVISDVAPSLQPIPLTTDMDIEDLVRQSDVVHCYAGNEAFHIAKAVKQSSASSGVPYTISVGGTWLYEWLQGGPKANEIHNLMSNAYRVILPTNSQRNLVLSRGLPANQVTVVTPGLPLEQYKPTAVHDRYGQFTICFVGRLTPRKNVMAAFKAFRIVHSYYPASRFVVVGDGPERVSLVQAIREAGMESSCILLGKLSHNEMLGILRGASVLCCPAMVDDRSVTSGLPFIVLESQAVGVPVVATRVGGIVEGIVDGKTGFLCPASDAEELAEYLIRLAHDQSLLTKMSLAAREWVQNHFVLKRSVQSLNEIFKSAAESRHINCSEIKEGTNA
jgi:glycosyltransferase involved in cell wall biosynthesis